MKPVFYGLIILGALLIYESWKGLKNTPVVASGAGNITTTTSNSSGGGSASGPSTGGSGDTIAGCQFQSASSGLATAELKSLASLAGFTGNALDTIVCIAQRESGGDPSQVNAVNCQGLLQYCPGSVPTGVNPLSALSAFKGAFAIYQQTGRFTPWTCGVAPTSPSTVYGCDVCPDVCQGL